MVRVQISREEFHRGLDRRFPKTQQYEYPCNVAKSKETCDITVTITHQPTSTGYLPTGMYHLDLVPCTCPRPNILERLQSLFKKKIQEQEATSKELRANCRVHNNHFDVLLKSNQAIYSFLE